MCVELVYSAAEAPLNQECLNSLKCQYSLFYLTWNYFSSSPPNFLFYSIFSLDEELYISRKHFESFLSTFEAATLHGVCLVSRVYPSKFCIKCNSIEKLPGFTLGFCRLEHPSDNVHLLFLFSFHFGLFCMF